MNLSVNIAPGESWTVNLNNQIKYLSLDNDPPVMAYLAGCSLSSQSIQTILDVQAGTLISNANANQASSQSWELLSLDRNGSVGFISAVGHMLF